ncbi:hypothetical protein [Enemella sp. A6]|uniref:hypothetical protein n=1 Tax=Enemella sp. A6 TaxID=3440152 RepID=UPI003EBFC5B5
MAQAIEDFLQSPAEYEDDFREDDLLVRVDRRAAAPDVMSAVNEHLPEDARIDTDDAGGLDTLLKGVQQHLAPDHEIRWFVDSVGDDSLGFAVLAAGDWARLRLQFGANRLNHFFAPVDHNSTMFDLESDEISDLIEDRQSSEFRE